MRKQPIVWFIVLSLLLASTWYWHINFDGTKERMSQQTVGAFILTTFTALAVAFAYIFFPWEKRLRGFFVILSAGLTANLVAFLFVGWWFDLI